jgi:hypothetical protein
VANGGTNLAMQQFASRLAPLQLTETMESMRLLSERTNASLAPLSKSLESFRVAAEGVGATAFAMQRLGEQFAASLAPLRLTDTMQLLAESFRQQLHGAFGFSETTGQQIAELGRQLLLSTDRHVAGVLLTRGWLGVERHLTTAQLAKLVRVKGRGKGVEIDRRMCAAFRRNVGLDFAA